MASTITVAEDATATAELSPNETDFPSVPEGDVSEAIALLGDPSSSCKTVVHSCAQELGERRAIRGKLRSLWHKFTRRSGGLVHVIRPEHAQEVRARFGNGCGSLNPNQAQDDGDTVPMGIVPVSRGRRATHRGPKRAPDLSELAPANPDPTGDDSAAKRAAKPRHPTVALGVKLWNGTLEASKIVGIALCLLFLAPFESHGKDTDPSEMEPLVPREDRERSHYMSLRAEFSRSTFNVQRSTSSSCSVVGRITQPCPGTKFVEPRHGKPGSDWGGGHEIRHAAFAWSLTFRGNSAVPISSPSRSATPGFCLSFGEDGYERACLGTIRWRVPPTIGVGLVGVVHEPVQTASCCSTACRMRSSRLQVNYVAFNCDLMAIARAAASPWGLRFESKTAAIGSKIAEV
ncbi:hypothetical protein AURDEDRAFT_122328 [Auricularia subglabra TFB-10046 SS5]|nr:hypothetical protein AURDEDRAFT_122328 [Auricularia subglabra TFB-10046 SS5]